MKNNYKKMKDHLYNGEVAYKIGYGNDYNKKCPYYEQVMARKKRVKSVNEANKNEKEEV